MVGAMGTVGPVILVNDLQPLASFPYLQNGSGLWWPQTHVHEMILLGFGKDLVPSLLSRAYVSCSPDCTLASCVI